MSNTNICSQCGFSFDPNDCWSIDDHIFCKQCLFGDAKPLEIYPIGSVFQVDDNDISIIKLLPSQQQFLYKLEDEQFITIVYYLDRVNYIKTVFRRRLDDKEVGVFASRTPHRLSRLAIQDVELLRCEGTTLTVRGLDALPNSPIIDIKIKWSARHRQS